MNLSGKKPIFRQTRSASNPYRMMIWLGLIILGYWVLRSVWVTRTVQPLSLVTPEPTRTAQSYAAEGDAHFLAGNLQKAIDAYEEAARLDPANAELLAKLARIQIYTSATKSTSQEIYDLRMSAMKNIDQAKQLAPDDSNVAGVRAFVLDWLSSSDLVPKDQAAKYLTEADTEAVRAIQLDKNNTLALAYYAEIQVDEQKWVQAESTIKQAYERDKTLMDVNRVYGYVMESQGYYREAIDYYKAASAAAPNLTFLYIEIGVIYRRLQVYDKALEYFQQAADLNEQLGINDPTPYIAIAKTYSQTGDYLPANLNVVKALQLNPYNQDVYGQLGIVRVKSKNYEGAIDAYHCALDGCSAQESCDLRGCNPETDPQVAIQGMPLSDSTKDYYLSYASILAGLHLSGDDKCQRAERIFSMLKEKYASDTVTMSVIQAGEKICAADYSPVSTSPTPSGSETPTPATPTAPLPTAQPSS